jgi:hypothetical protein
MYVPGSSVVAALTAPLECTTTPVDATEAFSVYLTTPFAFVTFSLPV